jgi:PAS domain S-box-containing protein
MMHQTDTSIKDDKTKGGVALPIDVGLVFDSITEHIIYQNTQSQIIWANQSAADSVGLTREQLLGRNCYKTWHNRSEPCSRCPVEKCIKTGKVQRHEIMTPDGRWWFISGHPVRDKSSNIIGAVELALEITAQKQAEIALRESEEHYRSLYESTLIAIWRTDIKDGKFLGANPVMVEALGLKDEKELIEKCNASDFYLLESRDEFIKQLQTQGEISRFETRYKFPDGTIRDVLMSARIHPDKGYIEACALDITEHKRAENALRESEAKSRAILSALPDLIFCFSKDGRYLSYEGKVEDLFAAPESFLGKRAREVLPQEIADQTEQSIEKALTTGEIQLFEYQLPVGNERRSFECRMVASRENEVLAIIRNISERQKAHEERKKLRDQLERAQRMESLGVLAGGVAHDLNNILGPLVAYPEMILMKLPEDSPARRQVEMMGQSAKEAADVIQDLLTLARRGRYKMVPTDLNEVVEAYLGSASIVELKAKNPNVVVEERLDSNIEMILGSSPHLLKVIMNLIVNAFDAMENGGKLTIETSQSHLNELQSGYSNINQGEYVILRVLDTGIGIEEKYVKHIFEPYYSKKEMGSSGSGLGLSVVYGIVKDHKGYYDINSSVGEGTEFILYFPVCREEAENPDEIHRDYSGTETVLVVDDIESQRLIASELLEGLGYKVTTAVNGHDAIQYLSKHSVDAVVLDMIMEDDFDGLDTYREIIKRHPGQRAIIVSGFSATDRVNKALKLGVGRYIKKPYTLKQLGKAVREELDKKEPGAIEKKSRAR